MAGKSEHRAPAIAITGGTGTGKSTVADAFARRGARILDADRIGHEVLREDAVVREKLVAAFGPGVVGPDGALDRKAIGRKAFGDPAALATLNAIVHPPLLVRLADRLESARRDPAVPLVAVDAALIAEWGIEPWFDLVIAVTAPREQIEARLRSKGLSEEEIARRIASQLPEDERVRRSALVIRNDGDREAIEKAVAEVWEGLVR